MNRYEVIVRQKLNGAPHKRTIEAIARTSIDALIHGVAAVGPVGAFTAVVHPFDGDKSSCFSSRFIGQGPCGLKGGR